jgi:hypothetical protein
MFIPGHGGVAHTADITTFADYLAGLRTAVGNAESRGQSGEALVNAVLPDLKGKFGVWGFFEDFAKDNVLPTAQELAGKKRVPQPVQADDTHQPLRCVCRFIRGEGVRSAIRHASGAGTTSVSRSSSIA